MTYKIITEQCTHRAPDTFSSSVVIREFFVWLLFLSLWGGRGWLNTYVMLRWTTILHRRIQYICTKNQLLTKEAKIEVHSRVQNVVSPSVLHIVRCKNNINVNTDAKDSFWSHISVPFRIRFKRGGDQLNRKWWGGGGGKKLWMCVQLCIPSFQGGENAPFLPH